MPSDKKIVALAAPTLAALWFLNGFAFRYLTDDIGILGIYWQRRQWLQAHIAAGIVPLLIGPILLWLGSHRQHTLIYKIPLVLYVLGVATSATAGIYLALHTDFGFVVATGFAAAGVVWWFSTILATVAIWRGMSEQHREWMFRSFVVTFSFVLFRILLEIFNLWGRGTIVEQMTASCWLSWSVPLTFTEMVLQGRKIFAPIKRREPAQSWEATPDSPSNYGSLQHPL